MTTPANRREAGVFVQWKGTDVCLDFTCPCGYVGHYDGMFAYNLRCANCGRLWEMPSTFTLTETEDDDRATQDTGWPHEDRPVNESDVVRLADVREDDQP